MELVTFIVTETFECKIDIEKHDTATFQAAQIRDAAIFDGQLIVQLSDGKLEVVSFYKT